MEQAIDVGQWKHDDISVYYTSVPGMISNTAKSNEDRIFIQFNARIRLDKTPFHLFAVFDGHGNAIVSQWLQTRCVDILEDVLDVKQLEASIQLAFRKLEDDLDTRHGKEIQFVGGSVACIVIQICDKWYLVNLGDCRAIVLDHKGNVEKATKDHDPKNEVARIEQAGGLVIQDRVFAQTSKLRLGVNVSRAFGGQKYRDVGIISEPSIVECKDLKTKKLIIASDGIFKFLSNQDVAKIVDNQNDHERAIKKIVEEAHFNFLIKSKGSYIDDASCILVVFNENKSKDVVKKSDGAEPLEEDNPPGLRQKRKAKELD